jgi:hypothetical protein
MGMGTGALWQLGLESDAKARWDGTDRSDGRVAEAGGISEWELKLLRSRLQGHPALDPSVEVYDIVYPRPSGPDYEYWSKNLETEFERTVQVVIPGFLDELCATPPADVEGIGEWWGSAAGHDWHKQFPGHAAAVLRQLIEIAGEARSGGRCVYASQWF